MIFDLLAPLQGPRRRGLKKLCRCMCHTPNLVEFRRNFFWTPPTPHGTPVPPLGHDPGDRMKNQSEMFYTCVFHLSEDTQSLD